MIAMVKTETDIFHICSWNQEQSWMNVEHIESYVFKYETNFFEKPREMK